MKRLALIAALLLSRLAIGHDLPAQLPDPQSVPEAWNVIQESAANIDKLLKAGLLRDVTFQIANLGAALQSLDARAEGKDAPRTKDLTTALIAGGVEIIVAIRDRTEPFENTKSKWTAWRKQLAELESLYPPETVAAAVYICSMHPLDRHLGANEKCSKCGMTLIRRHLPASSVYEKPGEATMTATIAAPPPLVVGRAAEVRLRLARRDGSPVTLADLVEVHTQKIHLLINDTSLSDYHHEHPKPTAVPGEYIFTFTPRQPGPYRLWADVVPANSGIQEYIVTNIPAETAPKPLADRANVTSAQIDGRTYTLTFANPGQPIHAGQTVNGVIEITERDGKPCTALEPVMGAFAHIVGFSEDRKTVVHIHPFGPSPTRPDERGGPAFAFKLYVPTSGFLRLYAQTQINGEPQFAPFGLTIIPPDSTAESASTRP